MMKVFGRWKACDPTHFGVRFRYRAIDRLSLARYFVNEADDVNEEKSVGGVDWGLGGVLLVQLCFRLLRVFHVKRSTISRPGTPAVRSRNISPRSRSIAPFPLVRLASKA
jgi:hypothetical protein